MRLGMKLGRTLQITLIKTRHVFYTVTLPFTLKKKIYKKLKYFTKQKKKSSKKKKKPKSLKIYSNSIITNFKFQQKPKYLLSKIHI